LVSPEERIKPLVGPVQVFNQNPGLADERHKIGISRPAGYHMKVVMIDNAGPSALPEVHASVEPMRLVSSLENPEAQLEEIRELIADFFGNAVDRSDVPEGRNHQVSGSVRELVENDEVVPTPEKDVGILVVFKLEGAAKNASFHPADPLDVFLSPGSGDIFHYLLTSCLRSLLGLK
jgi:hypothetical protein